MRYIKLITLLSLSTLTACSVSKFRDQLGVSKSSPDEFAVMKRAPLEIPDLSTVSLPEPNLGKARPQEDAPIEQARKTIYGNPQEKAQTQIRDEDTNFLTKAGAVNTQNNIRSILDEETQTLQDRNKPVAEKLFGIGGDPENPSATVVDPKAEAGRIQENLSQGKSVTAGTTPSIEE